MELNSVENTNEKSSALERKKEDHERNLAVVSLGRTLSIYCIMHTLLSPPSSVLEEENLDTSRFLVQRTEYPNPSNSPALDSLIIIFWNTKTLLEKSRTFN